jgi:hypothetical protein
MPGVFADEFTMAKRTAENRKSLAFRFLLK